MFLLAPAFAICRTDDSPDIADVGLLSASVICGAFRSSFRFATPVWFLGDDARAAALGSFPRCSQRRMISLALMSVALSSLSSSIISGGT